MTPSPRARRGGAFGEEMQKVRRAMGCLGTRTATAIVAHRGLHLPSDDVAARPLENTLDAFECAWGSGVGLCECDVALACDGGLVIGHDDTMIRVASDPAAPGAARRLSRCTTAELTGLVLKSGARPPTLRCMLQSAAGRRGARCAVEMKVSSAGLGLATDDDDEEEEEGPRLARRVVAELAAAPHLLPSVALLMSFSRRCCDEAARELAAAPDGVRGRAPPVLQLINSYHSGAAPGELVVRRDVAGFEADTAGFLRSGIDGLYIEYCPEMLTSLRASLAALTARCCVGVWFRRSGDNGRTQEELVSLGVRWVNTDFSDEFLSHAASDRG